MKKHLLPHFNKRENKIDMLVFHSFTTNCIASCNLYKVSAHYLIDEKGEITLLVKEQDRAWHAGQSSWRDIKSDINSHSIGIEIENKTLGQTPFSEPQIKSIINLSKKIIKKYNILPQNIVGHSDIAPNRKPDPGHFFPWKLLAKKGIGLWYNIDNAKFIKTKSIKKLLKKIGYETSDINAAAYAFCRRFLPQYIKPDFNISHLVDNVLPNNFDFIKEEKFIKTLQAVAYSYQQSNVL